jgi:hypothetical protein
MGAHVRGCQLDGSPCCAHRLAGGFGPRVPLGKRCPEKGGAWIALDSLLHGDDGLFELAVLRERLGHRVVIVGIGAHVGFASAEGRSGRGFAGASPRGRAAHG